MIYRTRSSLCVKEYCLSHEGYPFFDLRNQEGFVRTLMIRTASTGDLMVVLVFFHEDVERREALLSHLAERIPGNHVLDVRHQRQM